MVKHEVYPSEKADSLNSRTRKIVQNPKKLLKNYVRSGMKVLDLGCGPGMFAVAMAEMGAKVIAADLQQEMLDKLKENIADTKYEKNISIVKCDEDKINVNEKVDFMLSFYVLHEIPNKESFFKQARKILKDKAKLYLAEPVFEVSKNEFEHTLETAEKQGFKVVERHKYWLSRVAVLE
jgi:cyclopropane fatty-acyl-phospholipid synthase-like methyltransferase